MAVADQAYDKPGVNRIIAANLAEMADLLEQQEADGFRVQAYRHAADQVETMHQDLAAILAEDGLKGLIALPAIGTSIASAIAEMIRTGRWAQLDRLRGAASPEQLFASVPGIGPKLAARLHDELHLDTLEALEMAAHDGTLQRVPGFGYRRAAMVRASLAERLGRKRPRGAAPTAAPPVSVLLDVDREYRRRAAMDDLKKIAPKRFNPAGRAWLPVLHTRRDEWVFTVMFSNTQRAHELNRTHDWVVIYFHRGDDAEGQSTVVTETIGAFRGYRVVRGREVECTAHHGGQNAAA